MDEMPPSTGLGEICGALLGFGVPAAVTIDLAVLASSRLWLQIVIFVVGAPVAIVGMIVGGILGNGAADWRN